MSAPPSPLAADWLVLQAALELLTSSTDLAALVAASNDLWADAAAVAVPADQLVEVCPAAADNVKVPQGHSALRLTILSTRILSRGMGYQARTEHRLQLRALARVPDVIPTSTNAAAGGKGWTLTTGEMRARNLLLCAARVLESGLIGYEVVDPGADPAATLCTGIYDTESEGQAVDFPTGDWTLARATMELRVRQRTRSGISGWTPPVEP